MGAWFSSILTANTPNSIPETVEVAFNKTSSLQYHKEQTGPLYIVPQWNALSQIALPELWVTLEAVKAVISKEDFQSMTEIIEWLGTDGNIKYLDSASHILFWSVGGPVLTIYNYGTTPNAPMDLMIDLLAYRRYRIGDPVKKDDGQTL